MVLQAAKHGRVIFCTKSAKPTKIHLEFMASPITRLPVLLESVVATSSTEKARQTCVHKWSERCVNEKLYLFKERSKFLSNFCRRNLSYVTATIFISLVACSLLRSLCLLVGLFVIVLLAFEAPEKLYIVSAWIRFIHIISIHSLFNCGGLAMFTEHS